MTVVGLVLAAMLVTAGVSLMRPSCVVALVIALLSAAWFSVNNHVLEGPTLIRLSAGHGVTAADLVSVLGAGLAVMSVVRWRNGLPDPVHVRRSPTGEMDQRAGNASARERIATVCLIAILVTMVMGVVFNIAFA